MAELSGVRLIFVQDYYDGPLSGMASYRGHTCYFEAIGRKAHGQFTEHRRFRLRELTPAEQAAEERQHRRFEETVGRLYCNHLPDEQRLQLLSETWGVFYQEYPPRAEPAYQGNPVLGWFRLSTAVRGA